MEFLGEWEGPRGSKAIREVSKKEGNLGWAAEAEWDLTKPGEVKPEVFLSKTF